MKIRSFWNAMQRVTGQQSINLFHSFINMMILLYRTRTILATCPLIFNISKFKKAASRKQFYALKLTHRFSNKIPRKAFQ